MSKSLVDEVNERRDRPVAATIYYIILKRVSNKLLKIQALLAGDVETNIPCRDVYARQRT
jgi:hypothetical protein